MATVSYSNPSTSSPQPTFVYFISAGATPIKIGMSYDPIERLATLQTAHYQKLNLLYTIECKERAQAFELESAFHRWYDDVHIRNEWFNLIPKQIANDIHLLTKLAHSVVSATQHIATPELERMETRAEERILRRIVETAYSKNMSARDVARNWILTARETNPAVMTMRIDDLLVLIQAGTQQRIGRTSVHNARRDLSQIGQGAPETDNHNTDGAS